MKKNHPIDNKVYSIKENHDFRRLSVEMTSDRRDLWEKCFSLKVKAYWQSKWRTCSSSSSRLPQQLWETEYSSKRDDEESRWMHEPSTNNLCRSSGPMMLQREWEIHALPFFVRERELMHNRMTSGKIAYYWALGKNGFFAVTLRKYSYAEARSRRLFRFAPPPPPPPPPPFHSPAYETGVTHSPSENQSVPRPTVNSPASTCNSFFEFKFQNRCSENWNPMCVQRENKKKRTRLFLG